VITGRNAEEVGGVFVAHEGVAAKGGAARIGIDHLKRAARCHYALADRGDGVVGDDLAAARWGIVPQLLECEGGDRPLFESEGKGAILPSVHFDKEEATPGVDGCPHTRQSGNLRLHLQRDFGARGGQVGEPSLRHPQVGRKFTGELAGGGAHAVVEAEDNDDEEDGEGHAADSYGQAKFLSQ